MRAHPKGQPLKSAVLQNNQKNTEDAARVDARGTREDIGSTSPRRSRLGSSEGGPRSQSLGETGAAAAGVRSPDRRLQRGTRADDDDESARARDGRVEQVSLQHRGMLAQEREHHRRILGALDLCTESA